MISSHQHVRPVEKSLSIQDCYTWAVNPGVHGVIITVDTSDRQRMLRSHVHYRLGSINDDTNMRGM